MKAEQLRRTRGRDRLEHATRHVEALLSELEILINLTPTGPERDHITEANIHAMVTQTQLQHVLALRKAEQAKQ